MPKILLDIISILASFSVAAILGFLTVIIWYIISVIIDYYRGR